MYNFLSTKNMHGEGLLNDNGIDDSVERVNENTIAPQEYAVDVIVHDIGKSAIVEYVVR